MPAQVLGRWFRLYLILDLYSRKIVGWEVHDSDHADHAAHLVRRTALAEEIAALATKPVRSTSCVGTTLIIGTATFATSVLRNAMPAKITRFWRLDMPCTPPLANSTRRVGQVRLGTGRQLAP